MSFLDDFIANKKAPAPAAKPSNDSDFLGSFLSERKAKSTPVDTKKVRAVGDVAGALPSDGRKAPAVVERIQEPVAKTPLAPGPRRTPESAPGATKPVETIRQATFDEAQRMDRAKAFEGTVAGDVGLKAKELWASLKQSPVERLRRDAQTMDQIQDVLGNSVVRASNFVDSFFDKKQSNAERTGKGLDVMNDFLNLGSVPIVLGLSAAKNKGGSAKTAAEGIEKGFEYASQGANWVGEQVFQSIMDAHWEEVGGVQPLSPEDQEVWRQRARETANTVLLTAATAGLARGKVKINEARGADAIASRGAAVLGLEPKKTLLGRPKPFSPDVIETAYKTAIDQVAAKGGEAAPIQTEVLSFAREALLDQGRVSPAEFQALYGEVARLADEVALPKVQERMSEAVATAREAAPVLRAADAVNTPFSERGQAKIRSLKGVEKFAFETIVEDGFGDNLVKLSEQAKREGFEVGVKRFQQAVDADAPGTKISVSDRKFDSDPATFDPETGTIEFNYPKIREHVDVAWRGGRIVHDDLNFVFKRKPTETYGDLQARYMQELFDHEIAHAKTIEPGDLARLRAATESGNKEAISSIRRELETKAGNYRSEKPGTKIDQSLQRSFDAERRYQTARERFEELKSTEGVSQKKIIRGKELFEREKKVYREARAAEAPSANREMRLVREQLKTERKLRDAESSARVERLFAKAETKFKVNEVLTKIRSKAQLSRETQNSTMRVMKEIGVPRTVREKLGYSIRNVRTPEHAAMILERAYKEWNRHDRRGEVQALRKLRKETRIKTEKGLLKTKIGAENQKLVERIFEGEKKSRSEAVKNIADRVEKYQDNGEPMPDDVRLQNTIESTYGWKDQSLGEIKRTREIIESLVGEGKGKLKAQAEDFKLRVDKKRGQILNDITGGKPVVKQMGRQGRVASFLSRARFKRIASMESLIDTLSQRSKNTEAFKSAPSRFFREGRASGTKALARTTKTHDAFVARAEQALGSKQAFVRWYTKLMRKQKLGEMQLSDGSTANFNNITRGTALDIYLKSLNPNSALDLFSPEGNKFTPEVFQKITETLDANDMKMAQVILDSYTDIYPDFAEAVSKDSGAILGTQQFYTPQRRLVQIGGKGKEIPVDPAFREMVGDQFKGSSVRPTWEKTRAKGRGELQFTDDPVGQYLSYVNEVNYFIENMDFVKQMRSIFDPGGDVMGAIKNIYGKEATSVLSEQMDKIVRGGMDKSKISRSVQGIASNIARAYISTPGVVFGQPSSAIQFAAEARSTPKFVANVAGFFTNPVKNGKMMMDLSPVLKERYGSGFLNEVSNLARQTDVKKLAGVKKVSDLAEIPLKGADAVTTLSGSYALYKEGVQTYLKAGRSPEAAKRLAIQDVESFVDRTQSSSSFWAQSAFETSGTWYKLLTTFQNQPNKILQASMDAARNAARGRMSKARAAKIIIMNTAVLPIVYQALKEGKNAIWRTMFGESKEEEKRRKEGGKGWMTNAIVRSALTSPLVAGNILGNMYDRFQGKQYDYNPSPVLQPIADLGDAATQASTGDLDEASLYTLKALTAVAGVPYAQEPIRNEIKRRSDINKKKK